MTAIVVPRLEHREHNDSAPYAVTRPEIGKAACAQPPTNPTVVNGSRIAGRDGGGGVRIEHAGR